MWNIPWIVNLMKQSIFHILYFNWRSSQYGVKNFLNHHNDHFPIRLSTLSKQDKRRIETNNQ